MKIRLLQCYVVLWIHNIDSICTPSYRCSCGGGRQGRVVCPPGRNCTTEIGSIPWQVSLTNRGSWRPWCGGTLINDKYVLTAAHCLHRKSYRNIQVVLGEHDWTTRDESQTFRFDVIRIIAHPRFGQRATFDHDFALLRLKTPIRWRENPGIRPACMPDWQNFVGKYHKNMGNLKIFNILITTMSNIQQTADAVKKGLQSITKKHIPLFFNLSFFMYISGTA